MMQVHIDGITASRTGDSQFVMQKGLDIFRTSDLKSVLKHLKEGYVISTKYHNGVGERNYKTTDPFKLTILTNFLNEKGSYDIKNPICIGVSFQEFYSQSCELEEKRGFLVVEKITNGKPNIFSYIVPSELVNELDDCVYLTGIERDTDFSIKTIWLDAGLFQRRTGNGET